MAVKEVIYGDWEVNVDPDEMPCRKPMLRKFVQSAPPMYSHTLSVLIWGGDDDDSLTVNEVASRMRQYEDSLSRPLTVAAVEKLTEKTEKLFDKLFDKLSRMEERSYSSPARTCVAAIRRRPHPPRPTQRKQNTLRNILWFCLCDYGEDMTADCRPQFAFTWRGVQYTWNRLPQGWKHSPTICHGLIQTALEKGGAPEHLQYIDDIIVWGNTAEEVFKKAGDNGPTWSLWQKAPGETRGRPLGFWSRGYRGSEANYTPTEKEILAAYEGVRAASEVIGTEAQLLLAPRLPVLGWMFKGKVPSTHHATDATWRKHRKWKAAVWSPTRRVAEATEGEGESSQFAEDNTVVMKPEPASSSGIQQNSLRWTCYPWSRTTMNFVHP
ncbi:uncharacterized protein FN964_013104 isoform 1-T1 [Alca torda]